MSQEFDLQLNAYNRSQRYGDQHIADITVDEYEKSVWLTKAQEDIVIDLYTGRNATANGFEQTEELRTYLNELVKTVKLEQLKKTQYEGNIPLKDDNYLFKLPDDVWYITYECVVFIDNDPCISGTEATVTPVTQDEYSKLYKNPFRGPSSSFVLRLDLNNNIVELTSKYNIDYYKVRYLKRLEPIILIDLNGITIDGKFTKNECKLDESVQCKIVERAVTLCALSKTRLNSINNN